MGVFLSDSISVYTVYKGNKVYKGMAVWGVITQLRITNHESRTFLNFLQILRNLLSSRSVHLELRTTNYELRTTNYELRTTNYELRTPIPLFLFL